MESKSMAETLGSSLPVPCVQEVMAREPLTAVPPRYSRSDIEPPAAAHLLPGIPVIDMQKLQSQESMDSEVAKLHTACKDWGFFQLVNHGVSFSLVDKMKMEVQGFFNLPMEQKKKYWQFPGEIEGFGQVFVQSEEQKLDWADMFYMVTLPVHMRKPHLSELPLALRETLDLYSVEMKNLALFVLLKMGAALKVDGKEMKELFDVGLQSMRMNYYPPCPQPEKVTGLTPHSDASAITILLQVNEVEGLQIRKDGAWLPVTPLPGAFIVNVGDVFEIVSNGTYRSIEHRAMVSSVKERVSIATFFNPKLDAEIRPASGLVSAENPALFKGVESLEYLKAFFSRKLVGKSHVDAYRISGYENKS